MSRAISRNEVAAGFAAWRDSFEETPAGGMTGTGIHVLDALMRIAGPVRRVHAQLLSQKPPPDPHDSLAVLLEFASGVGGTLAAVRSTPTFLRVHAFGRNGSAEAVSRSDIIIRKSGAEPKRLKLSGDGLGADQPRGLRRRGRRRRALPDPAATQIARTSPTAFVAIAEAGQQAGARDAARS